jgi:hypothetical protein
MTYAGYKPNETASLGAITATGIDAITKINLEREKLDAEKKIKQDELVYKAALEAQKEAAKNKEDKKKVVDAAIASMSENKGKSETTIGLHQAFAENATDYLKMNPDDVNSVVSQVNTQKALGGMVDGAIQTLKENKNPSQQDAYVFEDLINGIKSNGLQPLIRKNANGVGAVLVLRDNNGNDVNLTGIEDVLLSTNKEMLDLDKMIDGGYANLGKIVQQRGNTTTSNIKGEQIYKDQVKDYTNMVLSNNKQLGNVSYLVAQQNGKTPFFYFEGQDKEAKSKEQNVIPANAEYIKLKKVDGKVIAELTENQKTDITNHISREFEKRADYSQTIHNPSVTKLNFTAELKNQTLDEAGEIYRGVINNNKHYINVFKQAAKKNGDMLTGEKYPFPNKEGEADNPNHPVFEYKNGVIKYLYRDSKGVVGLREIDTKDLSTEQAAQLLSTDLSPTTVQAIGLAGKLAINSRSKKKK